VSQVLTLYTTPVIYIFFDKLAQRFSFAKRPEAADSGAEPQPAGSL
jgi:multidrug efflux pump